MLPETSIFRAYRICGVHFAALSSRPVLFFQTKAPIWQTSSSHVSEVFRKYGLKFYSFVKFIIMSPFQKWGVYCFAHVGRPSVGP